MGLAGFANLTNLIYAFEHTIPPSSDELLAPILSTFVDDHIIWGDDGTYSDVLPELIGAGFCASEDYLEIQSGKSIYIDALEASVYIPDANLNAFYDASKNHISGFSFNFGDATTITPPPEAAYFRVTMKREFITTQKVKIYCV